MNKIFLAVVPLVAFSVIGCDEKPAAPAKPATPTNKPTNTATPPPTPPAATPTTPPAGGGSLVDNLKNQVPTGTAAADLKDKAVAAVQSKYDALKTQIADLKAKASTVPETAKAQYTAAMSSLDSLSKDAEAKFAELKAATADALAKAKDAAEGALTKVTEAISNAQKTIMPK